MFVVWFKSMIKILECIYMIVKLFYEVMFFVVFFNLCFCGIFYDKEVIIFFFESVFKEKFILLNVFFWKCIYLLC